MLIVTPMRNESANVAGVAATLRQQTFRDFRWVVVDDGSTDGTADLLRATEPDVEVLKKINDGGLIGGSAYISWRQGVEHGMSSGSYSHVMKLDADVRLASDYLERIVALARGDVGIAGGVIVTPGMREQKLIVPGPVKLYTRDAYEATRRMPSAIGFDVLDEVAASRVGLRTAVDPQARVELSRAIGASEGSVHGRYRSGRVSRWTGYFFPYFLVRCARYLVRKPYVLGSFAMLWGYATAGAGPYPLDLKKEHNRVQRAKLLEALRNPVRFWRRAYKL